MEIAVQGFGAGIDCEGVGVSVHGKREERQKH